MDGSDFLKVRTPQQVVLCWYNYHNNNLGQFQGATAKTESPLECRPLALFPLRWSNNRKCVQCEINSISLLARQLHVFGLRAEKAEEQQMDIQI